MLQRFTHRNLTWIDLENPTREEVLAVVQEFHIHPLLIDELLEPTTRAKAESYGNTIYLSMHFPVRIDDHRTISETEVDFVIGKQFIVTVHPRGFDPVYEFQKMFRVSTILGKQGIAEHAGFLFSNFLKLIYQDLEVRLEDLGNDIKKIEQNIFEDKESKMVREISETHRRILDIKQTLRFHAETLRTFGGASHELFGTNYDYIAESLISEYTKVANTLSAHKELLTDLKETNDSLLSTKTNEVMKFLTFITFTTLPFTLIASILGMNSRFTTDISIQTIFVMFGAAALFGVGVYLYFRKRTWL